MHYIKNIFLSVFAIAMIFSGFVFFYAIGTNFVTFDRQAAYIYNKYGTPLVESFEESEPKVEERIVQEIDANFDILVPSGLTSEELAKSIEGPSYDVMREYVDYFVEAEEIYGVNSFYLMCKLGLESGWGKYESGRNNIAGWRNYDGSYRDFSSVKECVMTVAKCLSTTYKDSVGSNIQNVCSRYSTNPSYTYALLDIMESRSNKIAV